MTKKMNLDDYVKKLNDKGINSIPTVQPKGLKRKIKHICSCGKNFERSPKDLLSKHATGVCDKCHKEVKRKNKLKDGVDNGYYDALKKRNHSLPINRFDYKDRHTAIIHLCKRCTSTYWKIPAKALRTNSLGMCLRCSILEKSNIKKEKGLNLFFKKIKPVKVKYISGYDGKKEKCVFECSCGDRFMRSPQKVQAGQVQCLACSRIRISSKQTISIEEHNRRMKEMKFKSKLLSTKIINNWTPLKYICECGEIFERKYSKMFSPGAWGVCEKCYCKKNSKSQEKSQDEYDKELKLTRPGVIRLGPYLGSQVKTQHLCSCGNDQWFPKPNNVLHSFDSCGCQKGKKCENLVRQIFEHLTGKKFPSIKPKFLKNPKTGHLLELDGFNHELNLAFEYDGIQHSEFSRYFHKNEDEFLELKERDIYKTKRCAEEGILLLRFANIEKDLRKLESSREYLLQFVSLISNELKANSIKTSREVKTFKIATADLKKS